MKNDPRVAELTEILAKCVDALARADEDELERCRERAGEIELAGLDGENRVGLDSGSRNLRVFARVLQTTRANLDMLWRFSRADSIKLEYLAYPAQRTE